MPATTQIGQSGTYTCDNCGAEYEHKTDETPMPYCPSCKVWTIFTKIK